VRNTIILHVKALVVDVANLISQYYYELTIVDL
jgi:hypothetical protein